MKEVFLGIDASIRSSGLALLAGKKPVYLTVPIEKADGLITSLKELCEIPGDAKVFVLIECPTWSGHGTKEVRAAVTTWERILKKAFPRRVEILRADPREWQKVLLAGCPGANTKEQSVYRARVAVLADAKADLTHDQADALCLLEYCQMKYRSGQFERAKELRTAARKPKKAKP